MNSYERTFYELNNLYCEGRDDGRKSARKAAELRGVEAEAGALAYALERGAQVEHPQRCLPPDLELAEDDALTTREHVVLLAGLRAIQENPGAAAFHFEDVDGGPPTNAELDALCERLNFAAYVRLETD